MMTKAGAHSRRGREVDGELHAPSLEVRSITAHRADWLSKADLYVTFRKPILPQVDANLKAIPPQCVIKFGKHSNQLFSEVDQE